MSVVGQSMTTKEAKADQVPVESKPQAQDAPKPELEAGQGDAATNASAAHAAPVASTDPEPGCNQTGARPEPAPGLLDSLSQEKQDRAAELKRRLADKMRNKTSAELDPKYITLGDELVTLFAGSNKLNSELTFDRETYEQAKPMFAAAVRAFGHAGQDVVEMTKAMVRGLNANGLTLEAQETMRPYLTQFITDMRDGTVAPFAVKVRNQTSSGLDSEYITLGGQLVSLYVKGGTSRFGDVLRRFSDATGLSMREAQVPMRAAYNYVRDEKDLAGEDVSDMDSADAVMAEIRAALAAENEQSTQAPDDGKKSSDEPETSDEQRGNQEGDQGELESQKLQEIVGEVGRPDGRPDDDGREESNENGPREPSGDEPTGSVGDGPGSVSDGPVDSRKGPPPPNCLITDDFPLGEGTESQNLAAKIDALHLVHTLEKENRYETPDAQPVFAHWDKVEMDGIFTAAGGEMTDEMTEVSFEGLVRLKSAAIDFACAEITRISQTVITDLQSSPAAGIFDDVAARHFWDEYCWSLQEGPFDDTEYVGEFSLGSVSGNSEDAVRIFIQQEVEKLPPYAQLFLSTLAFEEDTSDKDESVGIIWVDGIVDAVMEKINQRASARNLDLIGPDRGDVIGCEIDASGMVWSILSDRGEAMDLIAGHTDALINPDGDISELADEMTDAFMAAAADDNEGPVFSFFLERFEGDVWSLVSEYDVVPSLEHIRSQLIARLDEAM